MRKLKKFLSVAIALFMLCPSVLPQRLIMDNNMAFSTAMAASSDAWLVPEAAAKQDITIHNPTNAALQDMPVLIRLNGSNIPNKDGVSFYLEDNCLSSELASWNSGGISTYWVKIPELAANSDTMITAYYSGSAAASPAPASEVWSDGYELVQHFSESAVAADKDSTGNGVLTRTGTLTYKKNTTGGAASFTGSQKISYSNQVIGANAAVFSASAVVNFTSMAGDKGYYGIVCRDRNGKQTDDTFMLTLSNANVNSSVYTNGDPGERVNVQYGVTAGTTYLLTMTYDGANLNLYINGELVGTKPSENAALLDSTLSPFTIGAYSDADLMSGLKGDLYDVFFKTEVISAEEEAFRYANYLEDSVTAGAVEINEAQSAGPLAPGSHYLYNAITEDTYCFSNGEDGRNTNFGSSTVVMQKRTSERDDSEFQSTANRRAFVKLDLTELATLAPTRIESVTFDFYQNGDGGKVESMKSRIVDIDPDSWDESAVTWNNMPVTYGLPAAASQTITKKSKEYQSFDITEYVKNKIAEGKKTVSFSIDNDPASEWGLIWNSKEASENKPRLTVTVKEPAAPVISETIEGNAATLTAQIEQNQDETTEIAFYKAKGIELTEANTVVYSGETADTLPDQLKRSNADKNEVFSKGNKTTVGSGKTPYQIYEVTLSEEEKTQSQVDVTWTGNTADNQREVTAYFYNYVSDKWVKADSGSAEGTFSLSLTIPVNEALDKDGKIQILIWRGMNEAIEGRSSYVPSAGQYDFNIMWTTDTQKYTVNGGMHHVKKQFDWITDNFKATKSKLFIHTGDMVENYDNEEQWQTMSDMYTNTVEKEKIPYAFTVGNHDVNRYDSSKNIFQNYFPVSRLQKNNPYFGESFDDMTYYYLMEENGAKLMFVGLGIPVTQEAVDWVNEALAQHSDYTAILLPHIYLLANGEIDNSGKYGAEVTVSKIHSIVEANANVKLVLCGHWDGSSTNLEYFDGRAVWAMMHDYQGHEEGGYGYFHMLKFDIENNLIYNHTYSASNDGTAVYTDKQPEKAGLYQKNRDEYAISFDFGANQERVLTTESMVLNVPGAAEEQIGDTQTVTGPGSASVVWNNLEEGSTYPWYAVLTDEEGKETVTNIRMFTVPKIVIEDIRYTNGIVTVDYTASGISDGTPVSFIAFAAEEGDDPDTIWNGQNVAYQDIFAYSSTKTSLSFPMPLKTGNGIAGLDTTETLLVKIGTETANTVGKLFTLPPEVPAEIISTAVNEDNTVKITLTRPVQGEESLIVAVYSDEGVLLSIHKETAQTGTVQSGNEYIVNIEAHEKAKTIKTIWWSGLDTIQPLCDAKTAEKINGVWTEK